jgi:hypothetical protein
VTEVTCDDVGSVITATVFASDASGNIAACTSQITVVDDLAPEITCPEDQTVDPGAGNLFYEVPDYWDLGEATATDNCTDPVVDVTQSPAAGELLADGTYTVVLTATDDEGNTATCEFELTVESILGVNGSNFDTGISMFPNPAVNQITISNATNIGIDRVMIYDMNGRLVSNTVMDNMEQGQRLIDVSALASGPYIVQIEGNGQRSIKRLIKE